MPVKGVRVLPDIPKNMPNMEILIQEFETGFCSMSTNYQDTASKSSTSNDGNFVKKLVKAYESSVRASNENSQREGNFGFFNTLDVTQNQKNVEKDDPNLATYDTPSSQCQNNLNKKSKIFLTSFEECEVEDDFVIISRYRLESDKKSVSVTWPRSSSKINMYSSIGDDILMNVQSSPSKRDETWDLKKKDIKLEDNSMKNKLMVCSSPLEDVEDTNLDREDPLDDILTSSCDSSSNNSYRNLQADLYDFENKQWQLELSSTSLSSLSSSSRSSYNNLLSINSDLLDSSFQGITVTSSKNISKNQENLQNFKTVPNSSFNFGRKSPPAIGALLNEDQPIKINDDTCITWISALGEKLSRKKPLKKLLNSTFYTKLLNYKKVWKKSAEKQPNEHTSDSGFIDRFLSSSSCSSQKSWRSDPDEKPTFSTFGHTENNRVNNKIRSKSSRMVLTEVPCTTTAYKENRQNIESSLKSLIPVNSSTLKVSCGYPSLLKHPYLTRNGIPKHPFVTKTKLDQTIEKESGDEEMRYDPKECKSELESSSMSLVSQADLNILFSRMSEWLTSSPNNNCDLLRSRLYKSTSALDGLALQQTPVHNVPKLCNFSMNFLSAIHNMQREPCTRYATISPRNLRFSISREKSQAIERCFDV
ncbi:PREDICTED: uncharacterized protein LOC108769690 [Trachymyrmex cornetzi]|uniref:Uncharacterized protein n=1 Tax=Trachymyrmex cornetzi TaxID=471704 RepID=A0A151IS83_9HYME|nr:PREDICTED: uncharacterized protein LOC108769690 [Trachymyrmex cornetzi]KYN09542.1 hypothetical protein ALC57_18329 [Trachymyrmex cornetzi]